jgi:hypothetical protein
MSWYQIWEGLRGQIENLEPPTLTPSAVPTTNAVNIPRQQSPTSGFDLASALSAMRGTSPQISEPNLPPESLPQRMPTLPQQPIVPKPKGVRTNQLPYYQNSLLQGGNLGDVLRAYTSPTKRSPYQEQLVGAYNLLGDYLPKRG